MIHHHPHNLHYPAPSLSRRHTMEMILHSPVTLTSAFLITLVWGISLYGGFTRAPGPWAGPKLEGVVWGPCYNHAPMAGRSRASLVPRAPYERTRTPTIDNPQPWLQCHFSRSCESPPGASVFTRCDKISPAQHPQYRCYYRKLYKLP